MWREAFRPACYGEHWNALILALMEQENGKMTFSVYRRIYSRRKLRE